MVHWYDAIASYFVARIWSKVLAHFYAVPVKLDISMQIDCLACEVELFVMPPILPFSVLVCLESSIGRIVALRQGHNHKLSSHHL
jgi:hypothetical protein